jgi:hypothetical protein
MGFRNEAKEKTITDEQLERFIEAVKFVEEDRYVTFGRMSIILQPILGLRSIETCKT